MTALNISKDWCLNMAAKEGDAEIGAGLLALDPKVDANARLIAAAPDLLAALIRMRAITHQHISPACDAADAAIAKAKGETP